MPSLRPTRRRLVHGAAALGFALWAAGPVLAQADGLVVGGPGELPQSALPDGGWTELEDLLADLDSEDFAIRQGAFESMRDNGRITLRSIERALRRPGLSEEVRGRLSAAGVTRFATAPRGAIGFAFGMLLPDRITVGELFDNFPAAKVLEVGDLIVAADGFNLEGPSGRFLLQCLIVSHDPGEVMRMTVRRGARKLDLDVPLGSFNSLPQAFLPSNRYPLAWRLRVARLTGGAAAAARVDLPPVAWTGPAVSAQEAELQRSRRKAEAMAGEGPIEVAGGGMPRAGRDLFLAMGFERDPQLRVVQQVINARNARARVINFPVNQAMVEEPDSLRPPRDPKEDLADLLRIEMELRKQVGDKPDAAPVVVNPRLGMVAVDARRQLEIAQRLKAAVEAEMEARKGAAPAAAQGAEP